MIGQLGRRLLLALVVVYGVTLATFALARVLPGNPAFLIVGPNADPAAVRAAEHSLGLNDSLPTQYVNYMKDVFTGDLGVSLTSGQKVVTDLADRFPATLELALLSLLVAIVLAFAIGVPAALRPKGVMARIADTVSAGGAAMPQFWLGLVLLYVFFYLLGAFPGPLGRYPGPVEPRHITGLLLVDTLIELDFDAWLKTLWGLALPVITLAVTAQPPLLRIVQTQMRRALDSDPIRTARAIGVSPTRLVLNDALRLTLGPVLNMIALVFGALLSSSVLVETVFSWPGIGQYAVQAINASDYAAIQGVVLVSAVTYVVLFLLVDLAQFAVDPRLRSRS
jgi:peptide/nickel transport system permease protein